MELLVKLKNINETDQQKISKYDGVKWRVQRPKQVEKYATQFYWWFGADNEKFFQVYIFVYFFIDEI